MSSVREYVVRFQAPHGVEGDAEVELYAESGDEAIQTARSLPRFQEKRRWHVTAVDITPHDPSCSLLNIYRDGGETPTDRYYSATPAGSTCRR
jgi:hypothetical protein